MESLEDNLALGLQEIIKNLSNFSDQMNNHLSKGQQGTPTPGGQGSGDLSSMVIIIMEE